MDVRERTLKRALELYVCVVDERVPRYHTLPLQLKWSDYHSPSITLQLNSPADKLDVNSSARPSPFTLWILSCLYILLLPPVGCFPAHTPGTSARVKLSLLPGHAMHHSRSCGSVHAIASPEMPFSLLSFPVFIPHSRPSSPANSFKFCYLFFSTRKRTLLLFFFYLLAKK